MASPTPASPATRVRLHPAPAALLALCLSFVLVRAAPVPASPQPGWWRDAVFYEIFVRSFADASRGPLAGDGKGDLQGLIDHLDYLNDGNPASKKSLGVTALWLMPVQPSPSYHGYDVTDYRGVNPDYGDVALMKKLVREAHRRGIRVIVDCVLNHASSEHPLFREALRDPASPARAMFRFAPKPEQPEGPWGTPVWRPAGGACYYGIFSPAMPDWNFRDPAVTEHHRAVARFWLQDVGVDGLRLDAVRFFYEDGSEMQDAPETKAWLRAFTEYCHGLKPDSFIVGECYADSKTIASYQTDASCDSFFEFGLASATIEAVNRRDPSLLAAGLAESRALDGAADPWSSFLSNHDQNRVMSQLGGDARKARLAAELLFTLPGVPFVYYGEEIGMTGVKPDPDLRTPMQWTGQAPNAGFARPGVAPWHAVNANLASANVAAESADPSSLLSLYRRLVRLHLQSDALRRGEPLPLAGGAPGVYADMRRGCGEVVLVLANLLDREVDCPAFSLASSPLDTGWSLSEPLQGSTPAAPALKAGGAFAGWRPLARLAPESVYVLRFVQR